MSEERRRSLGRGLSALFESDTAAPAEDDRPQRMAAIESLRPGRTQPRRRFDEDELDGLASSIRENGILQPILVRPADGDGYEIVAGERRWRAAQRARLHEVPVVVRALDDRQALEFALVENIQRQDLNPIEEAQGYRRLIDEFGHSAEVLARHLGRSRSHVANTMRLLNLPASLQSELASGRLTAGHARALLNAREPERLAQRVIDRGLSVRETERLAAAAKAPVGRAKRQRAQRSADTVALERDLSNRLGLKVTIEENGEAGQLILAWRTLEQLDEVIARLRRPLD